MTNQWKLTTDKAGKPTGNIVTPEFRAFFVHMLQPRAVAKPTAENPNPKKKYSVCAHFPKGTDFTQLKKLIMEVATAKFGTDAEGVIRKQQNSDKRIFKDAGELSEKYAGFEDGCIYLNPSNEKKPGLVGKKAGPDGTLIEITEEGVFESGDYAIASIRPFAWTFGGMKGVSLSLNNVQMFRKGERVGGGRTRPNDDFEAYEEEDLTDDSKVEPETDPFA